MSINMEGLQQEKLNVFENCKPLQLALLIVLLHGRVGLEGGFFLALYTGTGPGVHVHRDRAPMTCRMRAAAWSNTSLLKSSIRHSHNHSHNHNLATYETWTGWRLGIELAVSNKKNRRLLGISLFL